MNDEVKTVALAYDGGMRRRIYLMIIVVLVVRQWAIAGPATQPTKFLRYVEAPDGSSRLEVAEATYKNDAGVVVHLIGAVHIADADFFAGLNESFDHYDALLYEMVKPAEPTTEEGDDGSQGGEGTDSRSRQAATEPVQRESSLKWVGMMQRFMKDQLHLVYQLDAIDYDKPNFVHADLDLETFEKMEADRGESVWGMMLQSAISNMSKQDAGEDVTGLALIGALMSPDRAYQLKRVLAQEFGDLDEQMDAINGPNGSVILTERNKVALKVMNEQIAKGKKFIGIFYGAGHLRLMEETLEGEGFKKVGVVWRTAWDIPAPATTAMPTTAMPTTRPVK
jgi:hypothetical protein